MAPPDSASSNPSGTATQRPQRRSSNNDGNPSSAAGGQPSTMQSATDGGASLSATSPNVPASSNTIPSRGSPLSPLTLLYRTINILTILLRVLLYPVMKISYMAFPNKEYDGVNVSSVGDRAARAFVAMVRANISLVRPVLPVPTGNGNAGSGGANSDAGSGGTGGGAGEPADQQQQQPQQPQHIEQYIEPECPFVSRGYNSTITSILQRAPNSPLLFVYLHSPLHRDGPKFIRNFVCHPNVLQLLNTQSESGNVTCFGSSVHSADGSQLRDLLGVTSFPFMALLSVKSARGSSSGSGNNSNTNNNTNANPNNPNNAALELLLRLEGPPLITLPPLQLLTYLTTTLTSHATTLAEAHARRLAREEEIRLREEQDREYQEALIADQIREMERREEEERREREVREREEGERRKLEEELERVEAAKSLLLSCPEPPASEKTGVARLRFALPNGKKIDRRFTSSNTLEVVKAFLIVHLDEHGEEGVKIKNFGMSMNFPKKTFVEGDMGLTLVEVGLAPQAVVMVQDLDA